jgi:hypothetical protein
MGLLAGLPDHNSISESDQPELDPQLLLLRAWQTERLQRTHADLLASKRYGPACRFFISDVYGSKDFHQRNQDIEYMYVIMRRFIPDILLSLVRNAINLHHMTEELDRKLLKVLEQDLGLTDPITEEVYAEGYRLCDNYENRRRQIDTLIEIGHQVEFSTRFPPIGIALRLAGGPAKKAGWHDLHDFLDRGYKSFKKMGKAKKFLNTVQRREMQILDRIYDGLPDPFSI